MRPDESEKIARLHIMPRLRMHGAILPTFQCGFMAWCLVKEDIFTPTFTFTSHSTRQRSRYSVVTAVTRQRSGPCGLRISSATRDSSFSATRPDRNWAPPRLRTNRYQSSYRKGEGLSSWGVKLPPYAFMASTGSTLPFTFAPNTNES
jgi:hypothetical protein